MQNWKNIFREKRANITILGLKNDNTKGIESETEN